MRGIEPLYEGSDHSTGRVKTAIKASVYGVCVLRGGTPGRSGIINKGCCMKGLLQ